MNENAPSRNPGGGTRARGFASMDAAKQREIARKGGRAAHEKGTAHEFTTDEAREAGRKGGVRVSENRAHMANIGRLGGKRSAQRRQAAAPARESSSQPGSQQGGSSPSSPEGESESPEMPGVGQPGQ